MTRLDRLLASRANYWGSIAADVVVSVTALAIAFARGELVACFAAVLGGAVLYTFYEYAIHRWLYHRGDLVVARIHTRHHAEPDVVLGSPFYYSLSVMALHGLVAGLACGVATGLAFGGAMLFSYVQQSLIHHAAHRYPALDVLGARSALRRHHALHHSRGDGNYGVSTAMWDRIFGTSITSATPRRRDIPAAARTTAGATRARRAPSPHRPRRRR